MYLNKNVEDMMLNAVGKTVWDKCAEVAKIIVVNKEDTYTIAKKIKRIWVKHNHLSKIKTSKNEKLENWRKEVFEIPMLKEAAEKVSAGQPRKRLCNIPSVKTENKILDSIIKQIEDAASEQAVTPEFIMEKIVKRSKVKWKIVEDKKDVPIADACALIYNINFSLSQYQQLRVYMKDHSIYFPIRHDIDTFKKSLMCEFKVESTKTSCNFNDLVIDTVKSLLTLESCQFKNNDTIHVEGKLGIDGSGSHQKRHQLPENYLQEENICDTNYIGMFWCPLNIKKNEEIV